MENFDTAESYCHGHSEALLGKVASKNIRITTKVGGGYRPKDKIPTGQITRVESVIVRSRNIAHIEENLESIRNLNQIR